MIMYNTTNTISLNREESTALKGLLILLIILGHNATFTIALPGSFGYLYTFHVQSFFILPFLYNNYDNTKHISFKDCFVKNFVRLYYPYILFFLILSLLCYITNGNSIDINKLIDLKDDYNIPYLIDAIFTGNYYLIDFFTGFQHLWFLPVMFSMSVIKDTIHKNNILKYIIMTLGLISYIVFFVFMYRKPYDDSINFNLMLYSPFAILQGFGAYFLGIVTVSAINNRNFKLINIASSVLFIVLSCTYIFQITNKTLGDNIYLYRFIMPFLFVNFILNFKVSISKSVLLREFGKYSFPMYIIHPPLCIISYFICKNYLEINLIYAIVIQVCVVVISYYISVIWYKITPLRKKTLPRSIDELLY